MGAILEFVKFAYERENMLLHISFGSEGTAEAAGDRRIGTARAALRRVEDIIGRGPRGTRQGRMPFMPQTVLLRPDLSPALKVSPC